MARVKTETGGRAATTGVIPGRWALSVGDPKTPTAPGFEWVELSGIARLESGHTPSRGKTEYWNGEIPWVGIRDATGNHGRTITSTLQSITEEGLSNSSARLLPAGTVCLSRTASVGYVITMGVPMATSQDFINWVCSPALSSKYLHYILVAEQESVRRFAHGTTHQTVYYPEAKAFHVCIPQRPEQDAIAAVLGALDDKIAINERIAATADELRSAIFANALSDSSSEFTYTPLSQTADFINGRAFTKDASGDGRMVIRIAEINSGPGASTVYNDIDVPDKHLARPGDVLFSWSGSLTVCRWFRPEGIINQHIFKVVPSNDRPLWLASELVGLKLAEFRGIAADKATTMGHIQRRHLDESVPAPTSALLARLDAQIGPLWERALAAEQESLDLASLRDTLLPQLMSGQLRVRDAERIVEEVV
ncbi:restriction endonuclease subunit S [Kitasatospora sp. MAP5-34]|uniref:restriction endonuclease subunit S n=1 Tax=Kitasatospora sp. MAP5-34 TaxID=3035102 RepID=UPI0024734437|nr:restriction endonuclease subunit S [Kitasatospora sp. MAP5-34]MDH6578854.1 type I restriction enzyme S subunit [Kitasatospora sp. MAP5-34]